MDVKEALQGAKKLLGENEWVRGISYATQYGKHHFCAGGALTEALSPGYYTDQRHQMPEVDEDLNVEAHRLLGKAATELVPALAGYVEYNDSYASSKEQVLALFDKALELA